MWYKQMARKINHTIEANSQYPNIQDLGLNEVGSDDLKSILIAQNLMNLLTKN